MSTPSDAILTLKARLTTRMTPEEVLVLRADVNVIADDVRFLESENAKLRELCKDMWRGAMQNMDYAECLSFAGDLVDKMRELRVEVDE